MYEFTETEYYNTLNKFFNKYKFDRYELEDVAAIGYVKALRSFELSKKTAFETYAFKCMYNQVLKELRRDKRYKRKINLMTVSLSEVITNTDDFLLEGVIADKNSFSADEDINFKQIMKQIKHCLTKGEYEVLLLITNNYKDAEIAEKLRISDKVVKRYKEKIKNNLRLLEICYKSGLKNIRR